MEMRLRIPECFTVNGEELTAYEIAKRSKGRIQATTLYRLARNGDRVRLIDAEMLEALADVLKVESMDELLERETGKRGKGRG